MKVERTNDAQRCKAWSKKHGHDTHYGDDDSNDYDTEPKSEEYNKQQKAVGRKCKACGSTAHLHSSHKDCPFNKKMKDNVTVAQSL